MKADGNKNEDLVPLKVQIADRQYPLKVSAQETDDLKKAEQAINEKLKEFQDVYAGKDKQDYLAMCALTFANQFLQQQRQHQIADHNTARQLRELEQRVAAHL